MVHEGWAILRRYLCYRMCRSLLCQPSKAGTTDSSVMITSAQPFKKLSGDIWARHHSQANDWLLVLANSSRMVSGLRG